MHRPDFRDVLLAQRQSRPFLARTPRHRCPALDALVGDAIFVKHENYQPVHLSAELWEDALPFEGDGMGSTGDTEHAFQPGQRVRVVSTALGPKGERLEGETGVILRQAQGGYYEIRLDRKPGESARQCFYGYQLTPIDDPPR